MTTFDTYTVEIGLVAEPGCGDEATPSLGTHGEPVPEAVLSQWCDRTQRFLTIELRYEFGYAVVDAIQAASGRSGRPAAIWRPNFFADGGVYKDGRAFKNGEELLDPSLLERTFEPTNGAVFGDREELAAFMREAVFEQAVGTDPTEYLRSCDSSDSDLFDYLREPPSEADLAQRKTEIESVALQLERLRPGPLYAVVVYMD